MALTLSVMAGGSYWNQITLNHYSMNRNSPVPLWAVLSVGVVLLGGVYVIAQPTPTPPQANVIVRQLAVSIPSESAAASPSVLGTPTASVSSPSALTTMAPSATSETAVPANDPYSGIVDIGFANQLNIPGKYQCGANSITKPEVVTQQPYDPRLDYPTDLFLEPSGKLLLHLTNENDWYQYDATFSKDCEHLYYFDTLVPGNHIHTLDVSSGKQSIITIPMSSYPPALVLPSTNSPYYPSLQFISAIDDDHLLLWFYNPVSGPDYAINDTSQAIYDIAAKTLIFVTEGAMDPTSADKAGIALLNYKTDTLIVLGNANAQGLVTTRTEIDLATGHKTTITLKEAGNPVEARAPAHSGDYAGFDTHDTESGYILCRSMWLGQLLGN